MSSVIRILIKIVVSLVLMFIISAIQMSTGLPHFVAALVIIAALRAVWKWQPAENVGTMADNEILKKD